MKRRVRIRGQVQGVGFRPFVWTLARELGLRGRVLNDAEGVLVFVGGEGVEDFVARVGGEAPPLARVDAVEVSDWDGDLQEGFEIAASGGPGAETRVVPDAATCPACLDEIRGDGRRAGYAFTNCTHCGPRFTIIRGLPYDRARTSMADFGMCNACRAEYEDPGDRRFHAQPIACPDCGPTVWFEGEGDAAGVILSGGIVAVKGLGGFHLVCDATNAGAVELLRERKRRPAKPLALMGTEEMVARFAQVSGAEWSLLREAAAPIVLLTKGEALPEGLAPGQSRLGWMLPYTPLHHLLIDAVGRPLVMTSGNLSGEPQVIGNAEARETLGGFVDGFLMHDREIVRRLDDSVERVTPQGPMVLRRARGRVPGTLPLPDGFADAPQVLAMGGQMKAAICLTKNGQALLGHHLGELDEALTWEAYQGALEDYRDLFDHTPEIVAVDLHEGYRATQAGEAMSLPVERVQHHHAHLASVMGENGWPRAGGPVAGIVLDGLGLGRDGTIWGGEVLLGDYRDFERVAHLAPAPLPGGDHASREPWRNLLVRLDQAGLGARAEALLAGYPVDVVRQAVAAGVNAPLSSSAGRLFDAMSAALGLCVERQSYEGEAAMRLEAMAERAGMVAPYPFGQDGAVIDPAPMFAVWAEGDEAPEVAAARFHEGLVAAFAASARALVETGRAEAVALSGGVMQNALLQAALMRHLGDVPVLLHHGVPANDGGLALGQALVAAARQI
ncbi:carbamoyltransferase HypF [Maritimibacter dapengensis]|uniref:Carbamoyltransferase HypF n=1 Tax=Maritimibacter dapengensis TaxID=2836868 RepID=A0ABS6T823_9RHOB|nr:carbamoyltransferase HypF [Maritimibacter dapengensis]MBV7380786.1 carbamoyltransferase HypF [Maritimibacter dapengensis]